MRIGGGYSTPAVKLDGSTTIPCTTDHLCCAEVIGPPRPGALEEVAAWDGGRVPEVWPDGAGRTIVAEAIHVDLLNRSFDNDRGVAEFNHYDSI
jgi:hypothetical protein